MNRSLANDGLHIWTISLARPANESDWELLDCIE
jgi:hypothetical protein